jgi:ribosomal protein RSM22 (predicted rRNA methylase)
MESPTRSKLLVEHNLFGLSSDHALGQASQLSRTMHVAHDFHTIVERSKKDEVVSDREKSHSLRDIVARRADTRMVFQKVSIFPRVDQPFAPLLPDCR